MITRRALVGMGVTVAGLIGGLVAVQPADAVVAFPTKALNYSTWLARAMDECSSPTTTVLSPGSPTAGCIQSNVVTDDSVSPGATMRFARLAVRKSGNHRGRLSLFGSGFHSGQRMKVQLTLRVTKHGQVTKHPPSPPPQTVTFEDVTVQCGNGPVTGCFTANVNGSVAGSMTLSDCLTQNSEPTGLSIGNIQILDSALVNCDTGKVIATPGILN
jgi:hypothetical protein